jgi:dTDP-4-amino-4,6-dideoxygalactose transaminase
MRGFSLDSPLSVLPVQPPVTLMEGASDSEMLAKMREYEIAALLVTNADGTSHQIVTRKEIEGNLLLSPPHIGAAEMDFVQHAFNENWVAPAGPNLIQFEKEIARYIKRDTALALSSCTSALHLALCVLSVTSGSRVYVSDLTFVASLHPILYVGAEPVLIDADPDTWNMSVPALKRQLIIDSAKGTLPSVIIVVHIYGQSSDMKSICELAEEFGIPVIEDAAESLGGTYDNRPSGSHGLLSTFSFNGNKIITTSGGGALVSDRFDLIDHARKLSTQGRDPAVHYQHSEVAYNYRMSNILAGIGLGQMQVLNDRVIRRRQIFDLYRKELGDIRGIQFQSEHETGLGNRWLTVIAFDPNFIPYHPYVFMRNLKDLGIESRPAWKPMHMQPLCQGFEFMPHSETQCVSSDLFLRSLCLPSGSAMTDLDVKRVASALKDVLEH